MLVQFRTLLGQLSIRDKILLIPGLFLLGIPVLLLASHFGLQHFRHYTAVIDVA